MTNISRNEAYAEMREAIEIAERENRMIIVLSGDVKGTHTITNIPSTPDCVKELHDMILETAKDLSSKYGN